MTRKLALLSLPLAACLSLAGAGAGCKKEAKVEPEPEKKAAARPASAKKGITAGNPELAKAVQNVIDNCEVSDYGYARNCREDADKALKKQESAVGVEEALATYCYALSDKNHLIQALAATQINRLSFSKRIKESANEEILSCLMGVLSETKRERVARPVVRAATYMATALKKEEQIIKFLESTQMKAVKSSGYGALWANGRMRVFDTLAEVIKGKGDAVIRISAINGFALGGRLESQEAAKVCELVSPLMTADEVRLAAAAANRVANSCPEMKDKVLDSAEEMIKKGKFDMTYTSAVRNIDGFFKNQATPAQKKRAVSLLTTVVDDNKLTDITRSSALRKVGWLDRPAGRKLARKYEKSDSNYLRRAAAFVLKKK
jgi:hypothetical protein